MPTAYWLPLAAFHVHVSDPPPIYLVCLVCPSILLTRHSTYNTECAVSLAPAVPAPESLAVAASTLPRPAACPCQAASD
eukprot:COSAG02_NODE_47576_length_340_cov_0.738589_1_plen_78_part_01